MKFEVTLVGQLVLTPEEQGAGLDHDEVVERAFDDTMRELLKLDGIEDPQVSGSITTGDVEISVVVEAAEYGAAISKADPDIRTAFHAAMVHTDGWDDVPLELRVRCYRVEDEDEDLILA